MSICIIPAACNTSDINTEEPNHDINHTQEGDNTNNSGNQENIEIDSSIVQSGYSVSGDGSDESVPFWCAYRIERTFNEADSYEVQLSFGSVAIDGWEGCDHVIVSIENQNRESYIYEEITAEEYFTEKYNVYFDLNFIYNKDGNKIGIFSEEIIFSYTETYPIPGSLCEDVNGRLDFKITAYAQGKVVGIGFRDLYYRKSDGQIHFMTIKEY